MFSLMHNKVNINYITLLYHFSNIGFMNQKLDNTSCQKSYGERATFPIPLGGKQNRPALRRVFGSILTKGQMHLSFYLANPTSKNLL